MTNIQLRKLFPKSRKLQPFMINKYNYVLTFHLKIVSYTLKNILSYNKKKLVRKYFNIKILYCVFVMLQI